MRGGPHWVASNLCLSPQSFQLSGTSFSDEVQIPPEGTSEAYVDVMELGGLHLKRLASELSE
eukprot:12693882-Prorocentrum_lima.AAC.1